MSEQLGITAIIQATDRNFKATIQNMTGALKGLKSQQDEVGNNNSKNANKVNNGNNSMVGSFGRLATSIGAVAIASKALGALGDAIGSAVTRVDTLNKYPKVMQALGYSTRDVASSAKILDNGIKGLPTRLDEITSVAQQLAPLTGSAKKASKSAVALNDAFLASSASAGDASRGLTQYTQMLATGKVDMMSWRTLMETMPVSLRKVANAFGYTGKSAEQDLYQALKDGTITIDQLNDKFIELDGGTNGFAKLAQVNSTGIATSFTNMKTAISRGVANMIQSYDKAAKDNGLPTIAQTIVGLGDTINRVFAKIATWVPKLVEFFAPIAKALSPLAPMFKGLAIAMVAVGAAAIFAPKLMPAIAMLKMLAKVATVTAGGLFKLVGRLLPIGSRGAKAAKGAEQVAEGAESISKSTPKASSALSGFAKNFIVVAAGVAVAAAGIWLITDGVARLAKTGSMGAITMAVVAVSIGGLAAVLALLGPALTAGSVGILAFGGAILLAGAGIGIAAAGLALLAKAITPLMQMLVNFGKTVVQAFQPLINVVTQAAQAVMRFVGQFVSGGLQSVINFINGVTQGIPQLIQAGINLIQTFIMGIVNAIPRLVDIAVQAVLQFVYGVGYALGEVAGSGAKLLDYFVSGIKAGYGKAQSSGQGAASRAVNGIMSKIGQAVSKGLDFARGFARGIADGVGDVWNAAVGLARKAVAAVKSHLHINSPSRVMRDQVGYWVPAGMAVGMNNGAYLVKNAAQKMADLAMVKVPQADFSAWDNSFSTVSSRMSDFNSVDGRLAVTTANVANINDNRAEYQSNLQRLVGNVIDRLDNLEQHPVITVDGLNSINNYSNKRNALDYSMQRGY